jgi:glycosyltransferase involved in cell wall biosynthesis
MAARYGCPYVVHLEDNEREILNRELRGITYEELVRLPSLEQARHIANADIRIHPHKHWEFLGKAAGCTVLIDRLCEHVPSGVPVQLFWPGYDDGFSPADNDHRIALRERYGIPVSSFVVLYSGAFHGINKEEICGMVFVLKILRKRGMPLTFVKTGYNEFPDLLRDGVEGGWIKDLGFLPREDLPGVLSLSDVLVQPGCSDPFNDYRFPSKLPEALATGVPIILPFSNLGKVLKNREQALVLKDSSMDGLIEQIVYLFEHPDERREIGLKGMEFCNEHLRWELAARKIGDFYEACLSENKGFLVGKGALRTEVTDNLSRSSSLPPREGGEYSRPVEFDELLSLFRKETRLDGGPFGPPGHHDARLARLEKKYARKRRRLKRLTWISLVELAAIVILVLVLLYSKQT